MTHSQDMEEGATAPETTEPADAPLEQSLPTFPIVGIGASAGGLAAFEQFFSHLPTDITGGMAFVLIQHLAPTYKSILTDLVKRYSPLEVFEVADGMVVQPNCVYVIPPNTDMALLHGRLYLTAPASWRGLRLPIDFFFRSLAQDQGERAICVILSGTGTDGTLGLKAIKERGGMAIVQDPASADYDGMPRSAIGTGLADFVLPPAKMAEQLSVFAERAYGQPGVLPRPASTAVDGLYQVFILLRDQTGHDFSYYKRNTIRRRIERRMVIHQLDHLDQYVRYLQQAPLEVETLFRELLIGVTRFFRDPEAFEALETQAVPRLLDARSPGQPVRVWVPGCSTGEEAYSIAILLYEGLEARRAAGASTGLDATEIQVFGTDIDRMALNRARSGVYPDSICADISPQRLSHFFSKGDDVYTVSKTIRDLVIFAEQNMTQDPPFSRLDLISCRNLLIYLGPELQAQALPLFHYALNPGGFLFLGTSETIGQAIELFGAVDTKWKLYRRKSGVSARASLLSYPLSSTAKRGYLPVPLRLEGGQAGLGQTVRQLTEQALLQYHIPACAVVNAQSEVLFIHGHTGRYLEPASGEASLNLLRMAREGLRTELAGAIHQVLAHGETVRRSGVRVRTNGDVQRVDLTLRLLEPASSAAGAVIMIVFQDAAPDAPREAEGGDDQFGDADQRVVGLQRELRAKEDYLQSAIEELETANEELQSANEELQSTNEELQSTNEELETSREELQSVNEELLTVNAELQQKLNELSRANNDMSNLLAGTEIATLFVDQEFCVLRFTPAITRVINLIQTDVGRPIAHIVTNLIYDRLLQDLRQVLETLIPRQVEVQTTDGRWYLMRVLPYRTLENVIDGAVVTFVEITSQKETQAQLQAATEAAQQATSYAERIIETLHEPLVVLDGDLRVLSANQAFYDWFRVAKEKTAGQLLYQLGNGQWDIPALRSLLEEVLPKKTMLSGFEVRHCFENIGQRTMILNAQEIAQTANQTRLILLAIRDVTEPDGQPD